MSFGFSPGNASDASKDKVLYQPTPFQDTRQRRNTCPSGSQNPCPTAVHITLLHSSLPKKQKQQHEVHVDVCAVAVTVLGHGQCCGCLAFV